MSRIKAALSHLLLSALIFSIVVSVLILFWYPAPYFTASGGWQGLKIAAGVDLVLGPLLTFIVFDSTKSRAKLIGDLSVIALLQFSALAWGVTTIYQQRPLAVVFWDNEFMTVTASEVSAAGIQEAELAKFSDNTPPIIYAEKPKELAPLQAMLKRMNDKKIAPHHQIELYRSLKPHYAEIKDFQVDIHEIIKTTPAMKADLMAILAKSNSQISDYDYFPLRSKYHNIILLFSHEGEIKDYISVPL